MSQTYQQRLLSTFLSPIKALRWRYVPLLMIYFAYGTQAIATVALTFWEKENLTLSPEELLAISVWVYLPWSLKMLVGQLVDNFPLLGSPRRSWIFVGAALIAVGYVMLYGMSREASWIMWIGSQYLMYMAASLVLAIGFVVQDVTADAMSTEVADRTQSDDDIKKELGMIQILGRLSLMISIAVMGGLGGWLADVLTYDQVFLCALIIPLISILGAWVVKLDTPAQGGGFDAKILGGGFLFAAISVFVAFNDVPYGQEWIFLVSLVLLSLMLKSLLKSQSPEIIRTIIFTFIVLFVFRAAPVVGPGYSWWSIDVLGFDESFFGLLKLISGFTALAFLWLSSEYIASKPVRSVLLLLIFVTALFEIPNFMLYYGVHEAIGVSARTIALFDTVMESPLAHISMIPMLMIIAYYAPAGYRATWFAVAASLMNLALSAAQLISKYLNQIFEVSREVKDESGLVITPQDYSELGALLWTVTLLGLIIPTIFVVTLLKPIPKSSQAQ